MSAVIRDGSTAAGSAAAGDDLQRALADLRLQLQAVAEGAVAIERIAADSGTPAAIARIFRLHDAELGLVLIAAGCEIDPSIDGAVKRLGGSGNLDAELVTRLFGAQAWDLLCPEAPLRRWRLVELVGNGPLRQRQVRLDERILQALLGNTYLDARLDGMLHRTPPEARDSMPSRAQHDALVKAWTGTGQLPLLQLGGADRLARRGLAANALHRLGLLLYRIHAADIPADWTQRNALAVLLDRELALSTAAILIESEPADHAAATALADLLSGPTLLSADEPPAPDRDPRLRIDLDPADVQTRREIWQSALGARAEQLGPALDRLAAQFSLDSAAILSAVSLADDPAKPPTVLADDLWQAARIQGRRRLDGLAERIQSHAEWRELVLPEEPLQLLHDLAAHQRDAWRVNQEWGWADRNPRGLGAAALFAGPSGTGKTLAAEVLASELALDLYRIDLSQVVSKYIGETEKNLARIFDAAEASGAILLFDEADALFGKRSEVKDSHDRYANIEVSYLLQRMEAYRGLAILTSNQKAALDSAFLRRLRYVLTFPFPDAAARARIWAQVFPEQTPREGLDPAALAKLNISGGSIRSIALNASYLAATVPEPVHMSHILRAARREYAKLEKPFTTAEQGAFR